MKTHMFFGIFFYLFSEVLFPQQTLSLGKFPNNLFEKTCVDKVKVGDNRPSSCTFGDVWYPVINEQFNTNHIGELLNNYSFKGESSDILGNQYYGDVFNLNTAFLNNGELVLDIKKGNFPGNTSFATALLRSLYKTRLGIYKARVKFPNNIYTWPAVWTHYGSFQSHDYEEIDWCEFYDNCPAKDNWICNKGGRFSWLRMSIHNKEPNDTWFCSRTAHSDMGDDYFNNYHEFGGVWTDYKIVFQADGTNKGVATKFTKSNDAGFDFCDPSRPIYDPKYCNNLQSEPECLSWGPFHWWCNQWNWAFKDVYFPHRPLQTIIGAAVNTQDPPSGCPQSASVTALSIWNSLTDEQRQTKIDYLIIYQPIKCYTDFQVLNEPHFKSITGGTNFLSGRKLFISNGLGTNLYINEAPKPTNNWHEFPTHILATDEIAFLSEVAFEEGTFLRAEIIDCNTGIGGVSQRINSDNNNVLPPVLPIDYFDQQDTLTQQLFPDKPTISETDNGAIQIHPNPTSSYIHIFMPEEDWNDLTHIYLITPLGVKTELPKSEIQDLSHLANGIYFLQFHFSNGMMVVQSIMKAE